MEVELNTVTSRDGTTIAYDRYGQGPVVILVDGALVYRAFNQGMTRLAELLSPHFTVFYYDRRGRGESTDTQPYAVAREVEDIEALIDVVGEPAMLYGVSSGAVLAMEAAIQLGEKVRKLALYEAPYNDDEPARQAWREYTRKLGKLLVEGRPGDAVGLFMVQVGMPEAQLGQMRQHPAWPMWEAVGHTLAYDHTALMGEDASVPVERAAMVSVPTLVMSGSQSYPFMYQTARTMSQVIPNSQHRVLEGQTHEVAAEALAPVLIEVFQTG